MLRYDSGIIIEIPGHVYPGISPRGWQV